MLNKVKHCAIVGKIEFSLSHLKEYKSVMCLERCATFDCRNAIQEAAVIEYEKALASVNSGADRDVLRVLYLSELQKDAHAFSASESRISLSPSPRRSTRQAAAGPHHMNVSEKIKSLRQNIGNPTSARRDHISALQAQAQSRSSLSTLPGKG